MAGRYVFWRLAARRASAEALRLVSWTTVERRWANVVLGLGGELRLGFQGFLSETWLALFPRSMPRRIRCGETGGAGADARLSADDIIIIA